MFLFKQHHSVTFQFSALECIHPPMMLQAATSPLSSTMMFTLGVQRLTLLTNHGVLQYMTMIHTITWVTVLQQVSII